MAFESTKEHKEYREVLDKLVLCFRNFGLNTQIKKAERDIEVLQEVIDDSSTTHQQRVSFILVQEHISKEIKQV